jgi:membrane protein implicated in regulation of membrane protease activity
LVVNDGHRKGTSSCRSWMAWFGLRAMAVPWFHELRWRVDLKFAGVGYLVYKTVVLLVLVSPAIRRLQRQTKFLLHISIIRHGDGYVGSVMYSACLGGSGLRPQA